jgi:hypothetical protein
LAQKYGKNVRAGEGNGNFSVTFTDLRRAPLARHNITLMENDNPDQRCTVAALKAQNHPPQSDHSAVMCG